MIANRDLSPKHKDIKFILDRTRIEEEKIVSRILDVIKKKPYPNNTTTHLARFIHSLFQTAPYVKHPKLKEKAKEKKEEIEKKQHISGIFSQAIKPLPMPPRAHKFKPTIKLPSLKPRKREYVVNNFNTPVGVLVEPKDKKFIYHVIEPVVNKKILRKVKELISDDIKKNKNLLDDDKYLREKIEKAAKKIKERPEEVRKIKYYLKRDILSFRRIDIMMQDSKVEGIYVNGINKPVLVKFQNVKDKMISNVIFIVPDDLNILISKLAKITGNELSEELPILNTVFHGFRISATKGFGGASSRLMIEKVF
ncbi:MAG: hypothetical protein U9Q69_02215 [Nanoarchaeota archaeon]|nr:hypothetical protein [Nanoarchaeota archaeon]